MTIRVAIVDDEQQERETLKEYLLRFSSENGSRFDVDEYLSGDALLKDYRLIYDIIMFDIDMPGTNGIHTARQVRMQDQSVTILFITNIAQYAINAFEVEAADYMIKPVTYYDFSMKFRRAVKQAARRSRRELLLEISEGHRRVRVSDIIYVEALGHYLIYHVREKDNSLTDIEVRGNMRDHESLLRPYNFCRTHKSYLVNLALIEMIHSNEVIADNISIPVGRSYKKGFMQEYLHFMRS